MGMKGESVPPRISQGKGKTRTNKEGVCQDEGLGKGHHRDERSRGPFLASRKKRSHR